MSPGQRLTPRGPR